MGSSIPARGWLAPEKLREYREDLVMVNIVGNRDGSSAVDYTVNPAVGVAFGGTTVIDNAA